MDMWLVALVIGVPPVVLYVWNTWDLLLLQVDVGKNSTQLATRAFLDLVEAAEREMMICDDGNNMAESLYNSEVVVKAVEDRLEGNPELRILCVFFSDDDTLFVKTFDGNERVKVRRGVKPRRDIHFKIIDAGRKGYISAHPYGATERRYKWYDCSRVRERTRQEIFGSYLGDMRTVFPSEAAVA